MDELKGKLMPTEESLSGSITSTTQEITGEIVDSDTNITGELPTVEDINGELRFDEADAAGVLSNTFLRGWSAYEVWLAQGNTGTEQDFFNSLASMGSSDIDYNLIMNRPQINSITLEGDRSLPEEELSNLEIEAIFKM